MMKQVLSALLLLSFFLSWCVVAFAAGSGEDYDFSNVRIGDVISFGSYEQDNDFTNGPEPIEWLVLAKEINRILVISRYGLNCQPYNNEWDNSTWRYCTLRAWLNEEFLSTAFNTGEQALIPTVTVNRYSEWEKVFLLSISEAKGYLLSDRERQCEPTAYAVAQGCYANPENGACWWWLRQTSGSDFAALVNPGGAVDSFGGPVSTSFCAVRPAMWINLAAPLDSNNPVASVDAQVGNSIILGRYEQDNNESNGPEPIEWLVLARENDRILVISRYGLDCQPYNPEWAKDLTWENCALRNWLNNEFLHTAFTEEEQTMIPTVTVTADKNPNFKTDAGKDTSDQVFLLSIPEAENYCDTLEVRACIPTAYTEARGCKADDGGACCWWLRSPGNKPDEAAIVVGYSGYYILTGGNDVRHKSRAVRPALWVDFSA